MKAIKVIGACVVALLTGTLIPSAAYAADQNVTIDFASSAGSFARVGAGFHYGLSEDGTEPADSEILPTGLNLLRGGGAQLQGLDGSTNYGWLGDGYEAGPGFNRRMDFVIANSRRITSAPINGRYALLLNDLYGLDAGQSDPENVLHPCDWSDASETYDCSNYVEFLNTVIDRVLDNDLNIYYWEVQNEPENPPFYRRGINNDQYFAMWDTAYKTIKARIPGARIAGPSYVSYNDKKAGPFLDHTKAAGTVPDIFVWHGLFRTDPAVEAASLRKLLQDRSIPEMPFSINEYLFGGSTPNNRASNQLNPGSTAYYLSRLNVGGIDSAARGIYPHPLDNYSQTSEYEGFCCSVPNLAGILPVGNPVRTDEWWTYATYGQMSGTRYNVTNGTKVTGTATADSTKKQAMILLGDDTGFHGTTEITVKGLNSQSNITNNNQVRVKIARIPSTAGALSGPETVSQSTVTVPANGTITLPFNWTAPRDAYVVYLTNPTVQTSEPKVRPNLVANPSFEADGKGTQTPTGWSEDLKADASYTEGKVGVVSPRSGNFRLTHSNADNHEIFTYQKLTVPNGTYTATAWTVRGGGQKASYIEAKNFGGSTLRTNIPAGTSWTKIAITDIKVTNGSLTIGVATNGNAKNWMSIDDFEVRLNP